MNSIQEPDVVLIGAGIMTATLAVLLKELEPGISIHIYERLPEIAGESSDGWNNAGTGHAAFCELNYTPQLPDGSIDTSKAIKIASQFEESKQFWAWLTQHGSVGDPKKFIRSIPHMSFVWGSQNVNFLEKRYKALVPHPLFRQMKYSEDRAVLGEWMPLVMEGRSGEDIVAATRMELGTDVNFGALTRAMISHLDQQSGVEVMLNHEIRDLDEMADGRWEISVKDLAAKKRFNIRTKFVFIGAGGGTLPLLDKSGIREADGYGGFPISGQWLRCRNENVIARHAAKVYGKASVGAPPMSVPHLDTRIIDGKKELLFGPFAGFSTKFLKSGSYLDLPKSIEWDNIFPMLSAGWHNLSLTKYLIQQVSQSMEDRIRALKEYYPRAAADDWELAVAGQRVQVIKKDEEEGGVLEFGTELVCSANGTLAGLLGASPGASTATSIMLEVLRRCFPRQLASAQWQDKLKQIIPAPASELIVEEDSCEQARAWSGRILELEHY